MNIRVLACTICTMIVLRGCAARVDDSWTASAAVADNTIELQACDVLPLRAGTTRWRSVPMQADAEEILIHTRHEEGARWCVEEPQEQSMQIIESPDGARAMLSVDAMSDNARSIFHPPLAIAPAVLRAGEVFQSASHMLVRRLDDESERERGETSRRCEIIGRCTLHTPTGDVQAVEVLMRFESRMRFATASVTAHRWVVPGVGAVAEQSERVVRVLGVISTRTRRMMVRIGFEQVNRAGGDDKLKEPCAHPELRAGPNLASLDHSILFQVQ